MGGVGGGVTVADDASVGTGENEGREGRVPESVAGRAGLRGGDASAGEGRQRDSSVLSDLTNDDPVDTEAAEQAMREVSKGE